MMIPQRVTLSKATTSKLRQVAAKTGLSPNIVARFAMLISAEEKHEPAQDVGPPDLTINRSSLFGELEPFLVSALFGAQTRLSDAGVARSVAAHIGRGASHLSVRVKSIFDLARIVGP